VNGGGVEREVWGGVGLSDGVFEKVCMRGREGVREGERDPRIVQRSNRFNRLDGFNRCNR